LVDARKGFATKIVRRDGDRRAVPQPPPKLFRMVQYESPAGPLAAYLTPDPKDGKKRPAIIWITGGDCNSVDEGSWKEGPPSNDQSASAFRKAGIAMMFPVLRGGNNGPGVKEGFLGEVDDILAAADFLAKQPFVDAQRIYLGGHSTGGTLVLLTAECSDRFRAVFSFGPVEDVCGYGQEYLPFDLTNPRELELRAPVKWLHSVKTPVFVLEGEQQGNLQSLQTMARLSKNSNLHFLPVKWATHFSILRPTTKVIASKILADSEPTSNITLTENEINQLGR
jgi:dipeptidyl aminopeptidase/acylaminoacyl peptidase